MAYGEDTYGESTYGVGRESSFSAVDGTITLGVAVSFETANELIGPRTIAIGRASESDTARTLLHRNDNWSDAREIVVGLSGTASDGLYEADNSTYTMETGEVWPTQYTAGRSAWWKYVPATSGTLVIDTAATVNLGSDDCELAVYTGTSLAGLTKVASDSDSGVGNTSYLSMSVTANVTYWIQIAAYNSGTMKYALTLTGPPSAAPSIPIGRAEETSEARSLTSGALTVKLGEIGSHVTPFGTVHSPHASDLLPYTFTEGNYQAGQVIALTPPSYGPRWGIDLGRQYTATVTGFEGQPGHWMIYVVLGKQYPDRGYSILGALVGGVGPSYPAATVTADLDSDGHLSVYANETDGGGGYPYHDDPNIFVHPTPILGYGVVFVADDPAIIGWTSPTPFSAVSDGPFYAAIGTTDIPRGALYWGTQIGNADNGTSIPLSNYGPLEEISRARMLGQAGGRTLGRIEETDEALALEVAVAAPQSVALGRASEGSETAPLELISGTQMELGFLEETDEIFALTAQATSLPQDIALGQASESNEARALGLSSLLTVTPGRVDETDAARALTITSPLVAALGLAQEVDAARPLVASTPFSATLGRVQEASEAQALGASSALTMGLGRAQSAETAQAVLIAGAGVTLLTLAGEADSVVGPLGRTLSLGQAVEAETAQALTRTGSVSQQLGMVSEVEVALPLGAGSAFQATVGRVDEADITRALSLVLGVGQQGTLEVALPLGVALGVALGRVVEADGIIGALVAEHPFAGPIGRVSETGTAAALEQVAGGLAIQLGRVGEIDSILGSLTFQRAIVRVRIWYGGEEKRVELLGVMMGGRVIPAHVQYWAGGRLIDFERENVAP